MRPDADLKPPAQPQPATTQLMQLGQFVTMVIESSYSFLFIYFFFTIFSFLFLMAPT